ncbi:hypothetical protein [Isachenkonia alkalipeptolytica]|uniref:Uncharacterized protein n=1 Tax=Isachenkonia alkalipeptolytica TaxID=2565777 RepID=A0AA44BE02_9CLOT|nr:hypothetical protein [Isachenkonia alkalipeptolytica]NBG88423.1 hypothetical protein [Isachenkonia alkalipeptolytica]
MWWFGRWDSTKGAWDIDMKSSPKNRKRKEGIRAVKKGFIILLIVFVLLFLTTELADTLDFTTDGLFLQFVGGFLTILIFGLSFIGLFLLVYIFVGIYYFIKYFKYSDEDGK